MVKEKAGKDLKRVRRGYIRVILSSGELATALAALRYWQQEVIIGSYSHIPDSGFFEENDPLTARQIDRLCERLNCS